MLTILIRSFVGAILVGGSIAASGEPTTLPKPPRDPNEKVCETVTVVGSRLGGKKICATRAEWAEKRKQDRDVIDQAQRSANIGCSTVNTHTGTPACD